jgi:hypothetical protein
VFDSTHTCDHEKLVVTVTLPQGVLFGRFGSLRLAIHTCLICTSLRCRACGHAGQLATRAYICGCMCCGVACLTQRGHGWFVRSASTVCICGAVGHTLWAAVLAGRHLWGPFVCGDASQTDIHTCGQLCAQWGWHLWGRLCCGCRWVAVRVQIQVVIFGDRCGVHTPCVTDTS